MSVNRVIFFVFALAFLSGCAQFQQQIILQNITKRIAAECPLEKKGQVADNVRCKRDIIAQEASHDPIVPFYIQQSNRLLPEADKYDAGKITYKQYKNIESDLRSEIDAYTTRLNVQIDEQNRQRMVSAFEQESAFARQQALISQQNLQNSWKQPIKTDCSTWGNQVHCTTR